MSRRVVLITAGWLVSAAVATAVGMAALNTLDAGFLGSSHRTLSENEVRNQLASDATSTTPSAASSTPDETSPTAGPQSVTPSTPEPESALPAPASTSVVPAPPVVTTAVPAAPSDTSRVLATPGGTVVASCTNGLARLLSWSPAQGYRADDVERGPAVTASIKFKAGKDEPTVLVTCQNGEPVATNIADDD